MIVLIIPSVIYSNIIIIHNVLRNYSVDFLNLLIITKKIQVVFQGHAATQGVAHLDGIGQVGIDPEQRGHGPLHLAPFARPLLELAVHRYVTFSPRCSMTSARDMVRRAETFRPAL